MMTNTYLPHVGGVARSVSTFVDEYGRQGHEVLVVAPTYPSDDGSEPPEEPGVVRLPAIQQFNGTDFSVRLPLAGMINLALLRFEPDIVHSHHPFLIGDTALRFAADHQAPVVFTHHTLYEEYTHYVPFRSSAFKHFVIELATHYANMCDGVIAPSRSIARLIRHRGVKVPIQVIPTGVDVEAFAAGDGRRFRLACQIPEDAFVVGHLGRLAPEKNLGFLTRAVSLFLAGRPEARFLVVGSGLAEQEIRREAELAGVADQLVLAGKRKGSELSDAYCAMDLFAFSSCTETQGMVLAEAMAAGRPAVALDASGVRDVVRDGSNGFLLPAEANEKQFAAALERLAADAALRQKFTASARRTACRFSREQCAGRALRFYEKVLGRKRRSRPEETGDPWLALLNRIRVEWELISERAEAAIHALQAETEMEEPKSDRAR